MDMIPSVTVLFFSLIYQQYQLARKEGLDTMTDTTLTVSPFETGIREERLHMLMEAGHQRRATEAKLARIRLIADILDNSVRDLYGKDKDVTEWVNSKFGSLRKAQEHILQAVRGRKNNLGPKGWFERARRQLREEGWDISPLGEPKNLMVDSATSYTPYAVLAHREMLIKEWHGELPDLDEDSVPNWALSDQDFDVQNSTGGVYRKEGHAKGFYTKDDKPLPKDQVVQGEGSGFPYWWRYISMGRFQKMTALDKLRKAAGVKNLNELTEEQLKELMAQHPLKQDDLGRHYHWVPDIRVSLDRIGGRFEHITDFVLTKEFKGWAAMEDYPVIREFIYRFYNAPKRLEWVQVGTGDYTRWACGMRTPTGKWVWAPVSHPSSNKMKWYQENEGKKYTPRLKRALYLRDWILVYRKWGDSIRVWMYRPNKQTGLLEVWGDKSHPVYDKKGNFLHYREYHEYSPKDWGERKRKHLKEGAKDAYFGYPEKLYQVPDQYKPKGQDL